MKNNRFLNFPFRYYCAATIAIISYMALVFAGCGGGGGSTIDGITGSELSSNATDSVILTTNQTSSLSAAEEDKFYEQLEKKINEDAEVAASSKAFTNTVNAPKKISLSKNKDSLPLTSTDTSSYDLSAISVTASLADGTSVPVSPSWSIFSGGGSIVRRSQTATSSLSRTPSLSNAPAADSFVFIPPALPGTTVLSATYTDNGLTRTALFRINVAGLASLSLDLTSDSIKGPGRFDLSKLTVREVFSDNSTKEITAISDLKWSKISGHGTFSGTVYTPADKPETAVFEASFTDSGIVRKIQFNLNVITITSIGIKSKRAQKLEQDKKLESDSKANNAPALRASTPTTITTNPNEDQIALPSSGATTYDLATSIITAYYSDGSSAVISPGAETVWTKVSGGGTLSGNTYTTATVPETAVFTITHTKEGISKSTNFTLYVVNYNSVTLSLSSTTIQGYDTFDLSSLAVVANYSNSTVKDVSTDTDTTWTKTSGLGTLSGKIYTSTAAAESAILTASYTEAGITKTVQFTINVTAVNLTSLTLSLSTITIRATQTYNLAGLTVTANYSNGTQRNVSTASTWSKVSGSGTLVGKVYTSAAAIAETAIMRASYTDGGMTVTTDFSINVITLSSLTLSPTSKALATTQSYNLALVTVRAVYSNASTRTVTTSATWSMVSGLGTLSGKVYTASGATETAVARATYTEGGVTQTKDFNINVVTYALSSIACNPTSKSILKTQSYNLSAVVVTATYTNAATQNVTAGTTWTKVSGLGTLSGTVYTSTSATEAAVMRATYVEDGVTKTRNFTINVVTYALSSIALSPTSKTLVSLQTYDLATEVVTATYTDATTANVSAATTWTKVSGTGTLTGTVFTAGAAAGSTVLRATYVEGGVTRTRNITITTITLSSIALTPTTAKINGNDSYDLAAVAVRATYSNASTQTVTAGTSWSMNSGLGTLSGKVYTSTVAAENAIMTATYTEGGVTVTANFTITVKAASLSSIKIVPVSDTLKSTQSYDLTTVKIIASYSNSTTVEVTTSPNVVWTKISGNGTLSGTTYTAGTDLETATLQASFTDNGVTVTANFKIVVIGLTSIFLSPTPVGILANQTYDLSTVSVTAVYSNSTIGNVAASPDLTWTKTTGAGSLAGKIYTATGDPDTATFTASYTESGITKTAVFTLNVDKPLISVTLSPSTAGILASQTYDLSAVSVTATYFDSSTSEVASNVNTSWTKTTGLGSLASKVYTPTGAAETATFTASYTEAGVTKSAVFTLNVAKALTSIAINPAGDSILANQTYDLSPVKVTATYSDASTAEVTSDVNTSWTKTTGLGSLAGKVYTPTGASDTATFTASYTEAGITKTSLFTLNVTRVLSSIALSPTSSNTFVNNTFDLSGVTVTAAYSDSSTAEVTSDANTTWTKTSGSGALAIKIYTAAGTPETATFTASYIENGITKTSLFTLNVSKELSSIALSPTGSNILANQTYDLTGVTVTATYTDSSTAEVTTDANTTWTKTSGSGSLATKIYTPTGADETATFTASYTESGITKTSLFTLNVTKALSTIALSPTSSNILADQTFDLSGVMVTATYTDSSTAEVTANVNTAWTKTSGSGSLATKIYTPSGAAETATFTASYVENGITKTSLFTLNVAKALSSIALNPVNSNILADQTYDLSTVKVTATYSDSSTAEVTADVNTSWAKTAGLGSLAVKVYTPTGASETATFTASYTEAGVTKTSLFTLNVAKALTSIALNPSSGNILADQTYDFSTVEVTATYSDASTAEVTADVNTTWAKTTGAGSLAVKVYTPTGAAETATFTVSYTEAGVTKTSLFTLNVSKALASIVLNPASSSILTTQTYDLGTVSVTATYSDASTAEVTADVNTAWAKTTGLGSLAGKVYTPAGASETATFTSSYTESGVTKTAVFTLNVSSKTLVSVSLDQSARTILINSASDLSTIKVIATFSDSTTSEVTTDVNTVWTKDSGAGSLAGKVYTAPASPETATFTVSHTADGVTKSAAFTANVLSVILSSISLNKSSDTVVTQQNFYMSTLSVTANYSDSTTANVSSSANTTWALTSGLGTLANNLYTPTAAIETVTLTATYTENGITKTIPFTLNVVADGVRPSVNLTDTLFNSNGAEYIYSGQTIVITATFTENDQMDETNPPRLTIANNVLNNVVMTKVSNKVWKYTWKPLTTQYAYYAVAVKAYDRTGNVNTAATGRTRYVIFNKAVITPPYPTPAISYAITPVLTSVTAAEGVPSEAGLGAGDTLTLVFDANTNQSGALADKTAVDAVINWGGKSFGTAYSGAWTDAKTLVLTVSDTTGADFAIGDVVAIRSSANIKSAGGNSAAAASSMSSTGSFTHRPSLASATGAEGGASEAGLGAGDTLTLVFDADTNQSGTLADKAAVDAVINRGGKSFGTAYSGAWTDAKTLVLTVSDPTGADFAIGNPIAINGSALIKSADGTAAAHTTSISSTGTFNP